MAHLDKHPEFVEGCNPCKWLSVSVTTVPGGAKDQRNRVSYLTSREKDLHRYRAKREAGERPDGTTKKAMERSERKAELWSRSENDIKDYNSPEVANKIKKSLVRE